MSNFLQGIVGAMNAMQPAFDRHNMLEQGYNPQTVEWTLANRAKQEAEQEQLQKEEALARQNEAKRASLAQMIMENGENLTERDALNIAAQGFPELGKLAASIVVGREERRLQERQQAQIQSVLGGESDPRKFAELSVLTGNKGLMDMAKLRQDEFLITQDENGLPIRVSKINGDVFPLKSGYTPNNMDFEAPDFNESEQPINIDYNDITPEEYLILTGKPITSKTLADARSSIELGLKQDKSSLEEKSLELDKLKKIDGLTMALKITDDLLDQDRKGSIEDVTGSFDYATPTFMPESIKTEDDLENLKRLLTVDNLKLLPGTLTENDRSFLEKLSSAGLDLKRDDVIEQLRGVREKLSNTLSRYGVEYKKKTKDWKQYFTPEEWGKLTDEERSAWNQ